MPAPTSGAERGRTSRSHPQEYLMIASISIADPVAALMLTQLRVDELGQTFAGDRDSRRRRRDRFHRHARLRKILG